MSWEHMKAELSKDSFHSISSVTDNIDLSIDEDCWYCDECGGKEKMFCIHIKEEQFGSMMVGVLCQSCMVKWFRVLGIEVDIPVPVGQQRLVIKEVSGHNLN